MPEIKKNTIQKRIGLIVGLLLSISILIFTDLNPEKPEVTATLAVAVLMAVWWITDAIPLAITSLLPVVLFPVLSIMSGKDVSALYFNHIIFLFIGGFLVALAMEKHNLHKRIAIRILMITGVGHGKILFGFMIATAFLSMWMSNTATAMMMVPVGISIIYKFDEILNKKDSRKLSISLLLGIAYSASIGGIATLIGTPPNLSFTRIFAIIFPNAPEITFSQWFIFALPMSIFLLFSAWIVLYLMYRTTFKKDSIDKNIFRNQYKELGKTSYEEKTIFVVFISLAILWITRAEIKIESFIFPGWEKLFKSPEFINDGTVAIFAAVILFIIPSKSKPGFAILEPDIIKKLPWGIVLLFGGGFALAQGFTNSGLAVWFGEQLKSLSGIHPLIVIFIITTLISFLTELTSNTATTETALPIIGALAVSVNINPLLFMIPATLAASMAFMLPVATPPNAIIFGTGKILVKDMMKTGIFLNMLSVIIISFAMYYWGQSVFNIDINIAPEWIK
jgi:sodium-dependent dicarboxylate transporter 2/3/5